MIAAKKLEMFPDELFLQAALKDGRATRQEVSMKALGKPDTRLQARERHLDLSHVQMLHEVLRQQGQLGPVVVFREGKKLWLADGFHRHEVYRRERIEGIPAFVIDGTYQEAVEYAAMCNRRLCLARNKEDVKKACFMLYEIDAWRRKTYAEISTHVGVHPTTAKKYLHEYCVDRGLDYNDYVTSQPFTSKNKPRGVRKTKDGHGGTFFRTTVGSKRIYLGRSEEEAAIKFDQLTKEMSNDMAAISRTPYQNTAIRGIKSLVSALAGRGLSAVFFLEAQSPNVVDQLRKSGVEFLTPDELIESLEDS